LHVSGPHSRRRQLSLALTAVISLTNAISLGLLSHLLFHKNIANGRELIVSGALIWLTNVLIFGLWYWQLDRGGPGRRAAGQDGPPDFQFTQMQPGKCSQRGGLSSATTCIWRSPTGRRSARPM
jgi:hypothetical protein